MKADQYEAYKQAVGNFLARERVKLGCYSPEFSEPEPGFEGFFSWRPCECCGSRLGGQRESYTFACEDGSTFGADICSDCAYYLAYGQLDDMQMMEIEGES